MSNLKQLIEQADDLPIEPVDVPEWNCTVYLKSLDGNERVKLEQDIRQDGDNLYYLVVAATLADENGNLLYASDIDKLKRKSPKVVQRLCFKSLKLNGMRKQDVDEMEKNWFSATYGDSCGLGFPKA